MVEGLFVTIENHFNIIVEIFKLLKMNTILLHVKDKGNLFGNVLVSDPLHVLIFISNVPNQGK